MARPSSDTDYQFKSVLVTGGCGFIGSHFLTTMVPKYKDVQFVNVDKMTYCSNLNYLKPIWGSKNFVHIQSNVSNHEFILHILEEYKIDSVVHFAAQSHVDNSFGEALEYTKDNILGTHSLVETCKIYGNIKRFIHVSTDEVYGQSTKNEEKKNVYSILQPTNPYSATKAAAEHIVRSYFHSFDFPVIITRGNNVYGKHQFPEKIIPKFVYQCLKSQDLTIHGTGENLRTYIHVSDVINAFEIILQKGVLGETYNIGSTNEFTNYQIAEKVLALMKEKYGTPSGITRVADRPFNDYRYHIDCVLLEELGWREQKDFEEGLNETVNWYLHNYFHGF